MNNFSAVAPIVNTLFNTLYNKHPSFGIDPLTISVRGREESRDMDVRALLASLNLIMVNEGTTHQWLSDALSTTLPIKITYDQAEAINTYLIDKGIVNKRASSIFVEDASGAIEESRTWRLTDDLLFSVQLAKEQPEMHMQIREVGEVPEVSRVKGKSSGSSITNDILDTLDSTKFRFHPKTHEISKVYGKTLEAETPEKLESKKREMVALSERFKERGCLTFELTHTQDSRGRVYARGGHHSTQGSKLHKAVIQFAEADETVNHREVYLYLGRLRGCKGTSEEAIQAGMLESKAPKSLEARAIVNYPANSIIRADGCSNGIQWMSAMLDQDKGMALTNLSGTEPTDLYSVIGKKAGLESRDMAKQIIMPYSYGASAKSLAKSTGLNIKQVNKILKVLAKELPITKFLNHIVNETMDEVRGKLTWTMPDGFVVVHEYKAADAIKAGNFVSSIDGTERIDERKMKDALAPNIIHSIDAYHARLIIRMADFPVVPIHDSFGCHSSKMSELRLIIMESFKIVMKLDTLNSIMRQLGYDEFDETPNPDKITNKYMFM
jgi:hypothetical protein